MFRVKNMFPNMFIAFSCFVSAELCAYSLPAALRSNPKPSSLLGTRIPAVYGIMYRLVLNMAIDVCMYIYMYCVLYTYTCGRYNLLIWLCGVKPYCTHALLLWGG